MQLTLYTDYSLRVLLYLGLKPQRMATITDIAQSYGISRNHLVKVVHNRLEEARIAVRNIRRDTQNDMRDFEKEKLISEDELKRGEEDLQKLTDRFIEDIGKRGQEKEKEIMEV